MMYYLIGCVYGLLVGACRRDSFLEASVSGPDVYHGDFLKRNLELRFGPGNMD